MHVGMGKAVVATAGSGGTTSKGTGAKAGSGGEMTVGAGRCWVLLLLQSSHHP
jgi:hypothetical protein